MHKIFFIDRQSRPVADSSLGAYAGAFAVDMGLLLLERPTAYGCSTYVCADAESVVTDIDADFGQERQVITLGDWAKKAVSSKVHQALSTPGLDIVMVHESDPSEPYVTIGRSGLRTPLLTPYVKGQKVRVTTKGVAQLPCTVEKVYLHMSAHKQQFTHLVFVK